MPSVTAEMLQEEAEELAMKLRAGSENQQRRQTPAGDDRRHPRYL